MASDYHLQIVTKEERGEPDQKRKEVEARGWKHIIITHEKVKG